MRYAAADRHKFYDRFPRPKSFLMRNYIDQLEAAYRNSRRQGDMMRNPQEERSAHQSRKNRYLEYNLEQGVERYARDTHPHRQTMDTHRPADSRHTEALAASHRGKGPRNYNRSDDRINEIVCDRLCDNPELDASAIEVAVKDSDVTLSGEVESKYSKRLAEQLAEQVGGVSNVENRIRVIPRAAD